MITKPLDQCDEQELLAALAEANVTIDRFKVTLGAYSTAVRQKQRVAAVLRDRFAIDAKTGKQLRRKGRGELDLTG